MQISPFRKIFNFSKKRTLKFLKTPFRYYDSSLRPKKDFKAKFLMHEEHIKNYF
jgi:hypothetical protein